MGGGGVREKCHGGSGRGRERGDGKQGELGSRSAALVVVALCSLSRSPQSSGVKGRRLG